MALVLGHPGKNECFYRQLGPPNPRGSTAPGVGRAAPPYQGHSSTEEKVFRSFHCHSRLLSTTASTAARRSQKVRPPTGPVNSLLHERGKGGYGCNVTEGAGHKDVNGLPHYRRRGGYGGNAVGGSRAIGSTG